MEKIMDTPVNWQPAGECCKPFKYICPCEARPKCCPNVGVKFILPRIPPVCCRPYCPGPFLAPPPDCKKRHSCRPLPRVDPARLADSLCPGGPSTRPSSNSGCDEMMTDRCNTAHWKGETKLTGYKTIGFAMPIPQYAGFRPRFPHPIPKLTRPGGCPPEYKQLRNNTYCCPEGCKMCIAAEKPGPALCVAQVHPYQVFNQVEKIVRTW